MGVLILVPYKEIQKPWKKLDIKCRESSSKMPFPGILKFNQILVSDTMALMKKSSKCIGRKI
jgi:hypothetical protein